MKILVVSDIHGNLPALEAVLDSAPNVDLVLCAGDLSGYFPYINEVVAIMAEHRNCVCVMGNHDAVLLDSRLTTNSFSADLALQMHRGMITPQNRAFIETLPMVTRLQCDSREINLFHGSLKDNLNGRDTYWETMSLAPGIYVSGHTHIPNYYETPSQDTIVINPGGTGFPRDGNSKASFALIDTHNWSVTFHRVDYDIARLIAKCNDVGLPPHFAKSIEHGTWISYTE